MRLKVGPYRIDVIRRAQVTTKGEYDGETGTIYIDENLQDGIADVITFHEAIHAVIDLAGLDRVLALLESDNPDGLEEEIVLRIAPLIVGLLRDNKAWAKKIIDSA